MVRKTLILFLFVLITPSLLGKASQEEKLKYYLSKELVKLGEWCYYQGLAKETGEIIKEAESLYPQYKGSKGHGNRITFDSEGLLSVLKDLQTKYNAKEKIFITGFSGGGNLTWCMIFCHPEKVRGAAPACANFYQLYSVPPGKKEARKNLPIKAFQGDKDQYIDSLLNPQWESAKKLCESLGYEKVSREMVVGVGHSGCSGKVMEYFKGLVGTP